MSLRDRTETHMSRLEERELPGRALTQISDAHADQTNPAVVEIYPVVEQMRRNCLNQARTVDSHGHARLPCNRVEVGIPNLDANRASQEALLLKLGSDIER